MSVIKSENWDGVTAPALPTGWVAGASYQTWTTAKNTAPNALTNTVSNNDDVAYWNTNNDGNGGDAKASAVFAATVSTAGMQGVVLCRITTPATTLSGLTAYGAILDYGSSLLRIERWVSGSAHTVATLGSFVPSLTEKYRLYCVCQGTTIILRLQRLSDNKWLDSSKNWQTAIQAAITATDSSVVSLGPPSGGKAGLIVFQQFVGTDNLYADDFLFETLDPPTPEVEFVSPSSLSADLSYPTVAAHFVSPSALAVDAGAAHISANFVSASRLGLQIPTFPPVEAHFVSASKLGSRLTSGLFAGGNPAIEWEVRLYNSAGKRIRLPREWIDTVEFEIAENGGYQTASMQLLVEWEVLQLAGNERVDIWLWGVLCYRGRVRIPQSEMGDPQRKSPTIHGLMESLNGYRIGRNLAYAAPTGIETVFADLVSNFIAKPGRLPDLVVDTTGVASLGLTLNSFDPSGKNATQAMNDLVNVSPGSLIWGFDVDDGGNDRIYLRPRSAAVKYKYSVGDKVRAFVYPRDVSQVKNAVFVTGGDMMHPNLAPNASFEREVAPDETRGNLLASPSFEDASGGSIPNWIVTGNPTAYTSTARTGSVSIKMDNNPGFEVLGAEAYLPALPALINYSIYARVPPGQTWHINITLDLYDGGTGYLGVQYRSGPMLVTADGLWHRFSGSWVAPATVGAVKVRFNVFPSASDSGAGGVDDGLEIDDAAMWFGTVLPEGWQPGHSLHASFAALDFASQEIVAYDGDLSIKVQPTILSTGGFVEICTALASRISCKKGRRYTLSVFVSGSAVNPPLVSLGARVYDGTTPIGTPEGVQTLVTTGLWSLLSMNFSTAVGDSFEPYIRFYNSNLAYIDGFGAWLDNLPTGEAWYPEKDYAAYKTVADYAGSISSDAAASITNYGLRQDAQTNVQILDAATLSAFLIGFFNSKAVPPVQGRLTLYGPTAPLLPDGSVQIVNLPSEPPALFPSRMRYSIGEAITIEADLGNQRPDLAGLLRAASERVLP